jgi:hypothetical protein
MSTTGAFGLAGPGCRRENPPQAQPAAAPTAQPSPQPHTPDAEAPPEFIQDPFEKLYPIFLQRKIKAGPKAGLWRSYHGRWVKWTGTVRSFTANGITLKQLPQTVTFDVSLHVVAGQRPQLRQLMKLGDRVSYMGRLDSYDDVFRTLYLVHGTVLGNVSKPDGGN